jgi:hypothetical protein
VFAGFDGGRGARLWAGGCGFERESRPGVRVGCTTTTAGGAEGCRRWWNAAGDCGMEKFGCFCTSIMVETEGAEVGDGEGGGEEGGEENMVNE